jgi:hypothetical protein
MSTKLSCLFLVGCLLVHGCASERRAPLPAELKLPEATAAAAKAGMPTLEAASVVRPSRKIIRNAELTVEVDNPKNAEQAATAIAEKLGGFTVSSELHQYGEAEERSTLTIELVLRVPAEQFQQVLTQLRALSVRVSSEKITGQDVTEEFIDLEARIRTEKALEAQYLDILKDAKTVKDALDVHAHLAEVREQIEKAEGRRHFLENQTSLSTVRLELRKFTPEVSTSGFGFAASVRHAGGDLVRVSAGIVTGGIRVIGVMLPILVMLGLPAFFIVRTVRRRRRRRLQAAAGETLD